MTKTIFRAVVAALLVALGAMSPICAAAPLPAAEWEAIPPANWKGPVSVEVEPLGRRAAAAIAVPKKEATALEIQSRTPLPAGLYEVRLTLRTSHAHEPVSFHSRVNCVAGGAVAGRWEASAFALAHQPEIRTTRIAHRGKGPLAFSIRAEADEAIVAKLFEKEMVKRDKPRVDPSAASLDADLSDDEDFALEFTLRPTDAVYFLLDKVEIRPLSLSGAVTDVAIDKIRYRPGETLRGVASVADLGGAAGQGTVEIRLEHGLGDRTRVVSLPVSLAAKPQQIPFELPLPKDELGYSIVAEFVSADGRDRAGAAEYFSIAENFQRVAIFGGGLATRDAVLTEADEPRMREQLAAARRDYVNAVEYFAWAPDDMVEMSPDEDFWSSGQTNYRMHRETIRRQIRLAHEQGVAVATYGKFVMSGLAGWQTAYDRPLDHRFQYNYPVGMWEGVDVTSFDRRRDGDFAVYGKMPSVPGVQPFNNWWASFLPINPDPTPRMARIAAEECVRSIEMFGWDAIRWDGHIRAGGQCGRSGSYDARAARRTQSLTRYFKEIVAERFPDFRHGYNYFLIEPDKGLDWAVGDFELDELCRGGGLLMNESIGNASAGWTFDQVARNLQADGDLCRERGGYYLGISFADKNQPRDPVIESALWAAAGCRPYNASMTREVRRYCTRYGQYTFDERLRRIATPEKLLAARGETRLDWRRFVYETPATGGTRQLVVNFLNLPWTAVRPAREGAEEPIYDMPQATEAVEFALSLPDGVTATAVRLIEPLTLEVVPAAVADGRFTIPPVSTWLVAVIDLKVNEGSPSPADLYEVPRMLGVERPGGADTPLREVVLDPTVEIWEVNKRIGELDPAENEKVAAERRRIEGLDEAERNRELLARRPTVEALAKDWWKGAAIPADQQLAAKPPSFGDLAPRRDGRVDIFYARGAMDYRLRLHEAFAPFERVGIHHAGLWGAVRQGPGMGLAGGVPVARYPEFDLMVFTGIPHCAIGVENSYALVEWVKAGGGAVFTGGEYAFGKGGYIHTVLERELLPVRMTAMQDTITDEPKPFEPGPDFADLGIKADFTARPSFWVRNEVVVEPGTKVFLKSGRLPVLVGRQVGKGRVVCLLVDHRGLSEGDVTAFFDWAEWPRLFGAALRWAAPEAAAGGKTSSAAAAKKPSPAKAREKEVDDLLEEALGDDGPDESVVAVPKTEAERRQEQRDGMMAIAALETPDRVDEGTKKVAAWNRQEADATKAFAKLIGDDTAILDAARCLDAEATFERLGWLAYLARHRRAEHGRAFLREWLRAGQYADECYRTSANLIHNGKLEGKRAELVSTKWHDLAARFNAMQAAVAADAEALVRSMPNEAADVLVAARFTPPRYAAINLLGRIEPAASREILERLAADAHPDLAAFARARLQVAAAAAR